MKTAQGEQKVVSVDIWRDTVTLRAPGGERRTLSLDELKEEVGQPAARRTDEEMS